MRARGSDITAEEIDRRYRGKSLEDSAADFFRRLGEPYDPSFPATLRSAVEEALGDGVRAIPGAVALVEQVRDAGIAYCVASSGSISKMHITLGQVGLLPLLGDVLFTARDVPRGKPAPDLFLHAAERMGVSSETAVVIEDSLPGVTGAVSAGMRVIGYSSGRDDEARTLEAAGAEVVSSMDQVSALIGIAPR